MSVEPGSGPIPDLRWAVCSGVAGILALASWVPLAVADLPNWAAATCVFGFGGGIALASVALYLGVLRGVAPRLSLLAAIANTVAAGELVAMALVQIAVKAATQHPGVELTHIWLGLDVAWDVFVGTGTVLFGVALWLHPDFRPLTAGFGVLVGALLLVLNLATFPVPPAEAGLFDVGPFVGLWYVVLSARVLLVARRESRARVPAFA